MNDTYDTDAEFNQAVIDRLEEIGRSDVAEESRQMDRNSRAMSSATVAREEGLDLTHDAIETVVDSRVYWVDVVEAEASQ